MQLDIRYYENSYLLFCPHQPLSFVEAVEIAAMHYKNEIYVDDIEESLIHRLYDEED